MNIFSVTLFAAITLIIDRTSQELKKLFDCNTSVTLLTTAGEKDKIFQKKNE
jgi:hypothetical protein